MGQLPGWLYFCRPSNVAFHNLCLPSTTIPPFTKSLLGLGLNFVLKPERTQGKRAFDFERLARDVMIKHFFAGSPSLPPSRLFIRSDWLPPTTDTTLDVRNRCFRFRDAVTRLAMQHSLRRRGSNLTRFQHTAFRHLSSRHDLIVVRTDKNLGPAIIERSRYIERALTDHLNDVSTYRQLTQQQADGRLLAIRGIVQRFISAHFPPKDPSATFLLRSLVVKDPFAYFYMLMKIHKTPWSTRPIVSVSGSLLHGLGRWVDKQLQSVCRLLPFVLRSSFDLVKKLRNTRLCHPSARLFTMDAVSMYTNIDTDHALTVISTFLRTDHRLAGIQSLNINALIAGLGIIMRHNVFCFGDTFWVQQNGTAMGTPPAPMYATLYYFIHEQSFIPGFPQLSAYYRYIDDGFGIWTPSSVNDTEWDDFVLAASFGRLHWTHSPRSLSVEFLDLSITILPDGRLVTTLYEKALNLYLYLPSHSAHPSGMLRGLVLGMILRILRLTMDDADIMPAIHRLFLRLLLRGYSYTTLYPLFQQAWVTAHTPPLHLASTSDTTTVFFHRTFHPSDVSQKHLHHLFSQLVLHPSRLTSLAKLPLPRSSRGTSHPLGYTRLCVANHRERNIGNVFCPRKFESLIPVSDYLA
jgi:hypothetical protein